MIDNNLYSLVNEQSLLGVILKQPESFEDIANIVEAKDFHVAHHREIYKTIQLMAERNQKIDVITVHEHLNNENIQFSYLAEITALPSIVTENVEAYARIVKEKSSFRDLVAVSGDIELLAKSGYNVDDALDAVNQKISAIADARNKNKKGFSKINDIMVGVIDKIEELYENDSSIVGYSTGFDDLDEMTSGLQKSDLIIVAGRPAMGKTTLSVNIAENLAGKTKMPVAIFSMEMPNEQLGMRMLASLGGIPLRRLRTGKLDDSDWSRLSKGVAQLKARKIFIDDEGNLSPMEIKSRCKKLIKEHGQLGLIVIDYLQLMRSDISSGKENRTAEISDISRKLKLIAKELNVPVIALSQLNRSLEQRPNKRPVMSDLRESGSIEQDADIIIFVYRDEVYNPDSQDKGTAEVIIGKQRNGSIGTVRVSFEGQYTRFSNLKHYENSRDSQPREEY